MRKQACCFRSSGTSAIPASIPSLGERERRDLPAVDVDDAFVIGVGTEDHPGKFGPAGPHKAGKADNLAGSDLDRHVAQHGGVWVVGVATTGDALHLEHDLARLAGERFSQELDVAPDHQPDNVVDCDLRHIAARDVPAVAEDGVAITDRLHFVQLVRYVDDADALGLQIADDLVQLIDLAATERRRRLVHDDELGVHGERLGDLDHLLLGDAERTYQRSADQARGRGRR